MEKKFDEVLRETIFIFENLLQDSPRTSCQVIFLTKRINSLVPTPVLLGMRNYLVVM